MKNFLNVVLVVLLTVIFFNFFLNPQKNPEGLNINFVTTNYTIPASVWVKVLNYTDEKFALDACENIEIRKSWEKITFSEKFCIENKNIEIPSKTVKEINYKSEYEKFQETGEYSLKVIVWEKEFNNTMTVSYKWSFSKIFTELIYAPIYNLFIWLIELFKNSFGWAIIAVTIIIRLILIWPQHKSMVSQRKLQELQPKIKKIQEEHKWDQQAIWMKVLELYKKEKVNPVWSCGFIFIQLPIILVLYNVILSIQDPLNAYYLYSFFQNFDFSAINYNFYGLELLLVWWVQWIILAVIVALLQFLQIKYSISQNPMNKEKSDWIVLEKKVWDSGYSQAMPDPEMMNKFMLYVLPLIVWFATYSLFAWVGVYWWISTLFMLVQQIIVNKMLKKSS